MTQARWGGDWTREKLEILRAYLDAYTTALKFRPFTLSYIDAFAGTGTVELESVHDEGREFLDGSARIALRIRDRPFDRFVFIEKDSARVEELSRLPHLDSQEVIRLEGDANEEMRALAASTDWRSNRAVAFLDPFATQTDWDTVAALARTGAVDTWILFPVQAIRRMLPRDALPESINPLWAEHLTRVFGDESWRDLYKASAQLPLIGERGIESERGFDGIVELYKRKLAVAFPNVAPISRRLFNSQGSPLFEFIFAAANAGRGGRIAVDIADHILKKL